MKRKTQPTLRVLEVLLDGPTYGYAIKTETGLAGGLVYTILRRLETRRWITARPERGPVSGRPRRTYYELTPDGRRDAVEALGRTDPDRPARREEPRFDQHVHQLREGLDAAWNAASEIVTGLAQEGRPTAKEIGLFRALSELGQVIETARELSAHMADDLLDRPPVAEPDDTQA